VRSLHANDLDTNAPYEYGDTPVTGYDGKYYCNGPLYLWCDSVLHYSGCKWIKPPDKPGVWLHEFTHIVKGLNVFEGKDPYPQYRDSPYSRRIETHDKGVRDWWITQPVPQEGPRAVGYRGGIKHQKSVIKSQGDVVKLASYKKPGQTGLVPTGVIMDELPGPRYEKDPSDEYLPQYLTENPVNPGTIDFGSVKSHLNEEWDAHSELEGELKFNAKSMTDLSMIGITAGIGSIPVIGSSAALGVNLAYWMATSDLFEQERKKLDIPENDPEKIVFDSPVQGEVIDKDSGGAASLLITQFGVRAEPGKRPEIDVKGKVEGNHRYGSPTNRHQTKVNQSATAEHSFELQPLPHPTEWLEENELWAINNEFDQVPISMIHLDAIQNRDSKLDDIMYEAERPEPTIEKPSDSQSTPTFAPGDQITYRTDDEDASGQDLHDFNWLMSQKEENSVTNVDGKAGWTDVPFNDGGDARVSLIAKGESGLHGFEYVDIDIEEEDGGGIQPGSDVKLTVTTGENLMGSVNLAFPEEEGYMESYSGDWLYVDEYNVGDPVRNNPGEEYDHYLFVGSLPEDSSATVKFTTEGNWQDAHLESSSFVELDAEEI